MQRISEPCLIQNLMHPRPIFVLLRQDNNFLVSSLRYTGHLYLRSLGYNTYIDTPERLAMIKNAFHTLVSKSRKRLDAKLMIKLTWDLAFYESVQSEISHSHLIESQTNLAAQIESFAETGCILTQDYAQREDVLLALKKLHSSHDIIVLTEGGANSSEPRPFYESVANCPMQIANLYEDKEGSERQHIGRLFTHYTIVATTLARSYQCAHENDYEKALSYLQRAQNQCLQLHGYNHQHVLSLTIQAQVCDVLWQQGKSEAAEKLCQRVLDGLKACPMSKYKTNCYIQLIAAKQKLKRTSTPVSIPEMPESFY
jgi:hypothetical protein